VAFSRKKSIVRSVFPQRPDASLERQWLAERRNCEGAWYNVPTQLLGRADEVID
jgi:hypothetical protein